MDALMAVNVSKPDNVGQRENGGAARSRSGQWHWHA
jgi:hypothetical protein